LSKTFIALLLPVVHIPSYRRPETASYTAGD
jgi:hypothetical protein